MSKCLIFFHGVVPPSRRYEVHAVGDVFLTETRVDLWHRDDDVGRYQCQYQGFERYPQ